MSDILLILIIVTIGAAIGSVGALFLKLGSKHFVIKLSWQGILAIMKNYDLMLGILFYGISTITFIYALRLGELSIVYPITSLGYVFITILSARILKEHINAYKIFGIAFIIIGVILITR